LDEQVKIRGFRIELGEIEAVLTQHPDISEAFVTVHEDTQGNKRLVAYIISPNAENLRQFLKNKLPDYMIPSAFISLSAFPLTANGKIDRKALPNPDLSIQRNSLVLPRTPNEEILYQIWTEVLGRETISIHDNFFELGGDSILSIQIIAKANQKGLKLTPKQLFEHQTIALISAVAESVSPTRAEQGIITGEIPLTPIQRWFFEQNLIEPHHYNQSVLLEMMPQVQPDILEQVLQQLSIHHDTLRLRFTLSELGWQQFNTTPDENIPLSIIDLSGQSIEKIEEIATQTQASLNLTDGPIFRGVWFNFGEEEPSYLLLVIHHLAVDGISWRILLEDLATAYQQLVKGETIKLPEKTTSYKDWANYLIRSSDAVEIINHELSSLPVDYSEEDNTIASTAQITTSLTVEETQALLKDVPSVYQTQINDVLLTALAQSLTQWIGGSKLLIDLESYGRDIDEIDVSRTVGWFTAIAPVLLDLSNINSSEDALKSIKEQLRKMTINLRALATLKAEISFNYLGQLDRIKLDFPIVKLLDDCQGVRRSLRQTRHYLLEINGFIAEGKLQMNWVYSRNRHRKDTIEGLVKDYINALRSSIVHCQNVGMKGYTPSDFSAAKLEQKQLDKFLNKLNKGKYETKK
jgi:non-ribosomal peptide synthase protein (TIGR01720 family)